MTSGGEERWERAHVVVAAATESAVDIVREGRNTRERQPIESLRRPRRTDEMGGLGEGSQILALFGKWVAGIASGIADEQGSADGRLGVDLFPSNGRAPISTTVSRREVRAWGGESPTTLRGPRSRMRAGSVVLACRAALTLTQTLTQTHRLPYG